MARPRNHAADFAVYLIIRLTAAFLRALPFQTASWLANGLARTLMKLAPRRVQVARDNLRFAYPNQYDDEAIDRLVIGMYRHFCQVLVEIIHLDRLVRPSNWRDHFQFANQEQYRQFNEVTLSGRGVMMVTGHFGNWEVSSYVLGMLGFSGYAIARPLDNVYLERWMHRWREASGQKLIAKKGEFELIEYALRNGCILGTIGDQDAGQRGLYVPFFDRPASTHKAIALLALEHKPIMIVGGAARIGPGLRYRCHLEDVIDPWEYENHPNAVMAITARFTAALERLVRQYPEQYLWIHRRWKHQPLPAKQKKAA